MKRILIVAVAATAAAAGLSACEKPNPGVTVWSGTNSQHAAALCWSSNPTVTVSARGCAADVVQKATAGGKVPTIKVIPGSTVGISVDPVVADNGWFPAIAGQRLSQTPIKSTYFRFTFPQAQIPAEGYTLEIIGRGTQANDTRGIWVFRLQSGGV